MTRSPRWLPVALATALAASLTGCWDNPAAPTTGQPDANGNATLQTPDGKPADFTKLSQFDAGIWSDTAIDASGTIHAVFSETPKGGMPTLYYRASRDGGATWSEAKELNERGTAVGFPHVAVDGQGRVYAMWKIVKTAASEDSSLGGAYGLPLVYRVLSGGTWSDTTAIDANKQVRSWFPSVDPTGQLHVVWVENIKAADGYQTIHPGRVMQASLTGTTATAKELFQAKPANDPDDAGYTWYLDDYGGLRGYVDAQGTAHWTAYKVAARSDDADAMLVHWDGKTETPILKYATYSTFFNTYDNPAELAVDANGVEHVLVPDIKGTRKAVLDFVGGAKEGKPVYQAKDTTGQLRTFQLARGPKGELAAMMAFKEGTDSNATFELLVSRFDGTSWGAPVNVTNNSLRRTSKEFGTRTNGTDVSTVFEPAYASGAFDASGKLNMVMVNNELAFINSTSTGSVYGEAVQVNDGGMVMNPQVLFIKL